MLSLLRSSLLLGVVDLVDVFVGLDQVHGEFSERSSARVTILWLHSSRLPCCCHGQERTSFTAGAGVMEAHHVRQQVVSLAAQTRDHGVGMLQRHRSQLQGPAVVVDDGALVLLLLLLLLRRLFGEGRGDVGWGRGAEVDQRILSHDPPVQMSWHWLGSTGRVHVERGKLCAGEWHGSLQDEVLARIGVGVPGGDDHATRGYCGQLLHDKNNELSLFVALVTMINNQT